MEMDYVFSLNPRVRNTTEYSKEVEVGAENHQEPRYLAFLTSLSLSLGPPGDTKSRILHLFAVLLHSPASHQPSSSLLISSQMAIPTAESFCVPLPGPPERLRVQQPSVVQSVIAKAVGPTWDSPLSRAARASPLRRDRQVLQADRHVRLAVRVTGA